jgi:hypothetical protein
VPSETKIVEKTWRPWRGTPADIVRLARRVEELLAAANAANPQAVVLVKHQHGESRYESAEEASEHLGNVDLETVETIHILAGESWRDVAIIINFPKTGPFLKIEGTGDHHLTVAGIADDLSVELDRGDRSYPHARAIAWTLATVGLALVVGSLGTTAADAPRAVSFALDGLGLLLILGSLWIVSIRSIFVPNLGLLIGVTSPTLAGWLRCGRHERIIRRAGDAYGGRGAVPALSARLRGGIPPPFTRVDGYS